MIIIEPLPMMPWCVCALPDRGMWYVKLARDKDGLAEESSISTIQVPLVAWFLRRMLRLGAQLG